MPAPSHFLPFAHHLADLSGDVIRPWYRTDLALIDKGGHYDYDPVTEGDRAGETVMRAAITATHPDHGILGEEHGRRAGTGPWEWVLDPIDGTRAFVAGLPTWGTIIGLREGGAPVLGVVNQPISGERWWGSDAGAFVRDHRGERPIRARRGVTLRDAVFATTTPELFQTPAQQALLAALQAGTRLRRYGGDCFNYVLIAMGSIDVVVERALQPYDVVGVIPIIEAAGGVITNWAGGPAGDGGGAVAAGSPELHAEVMRLVRESGATE